jgi:hypothetical protein
MRIACVIVGAVALAHAGCDAKHADRPTYPVNGEVLRGGKPAAGGTVQFVHQTDSGVRAVGEIGSDGKFTLSTFVGGEKRAGAVEGPYKVVLVFKATDPAFHPKAVYRVEARENTFKIVIP